MMNWICGVKKREASTNRFSFNPDLNKQVENEAINWNRKIKTHLTRQADVRWKRNVQSLKCQLDI